MLHTSKARPWGWSLGRSVPKTSSGCPERRTLTPTRYDDASGQQGGQHAVLDLSRCTSRRAAGGRSIRSLREHAARRRRTIRAGRRHRGSRGSPVDPPAAAAPAQAYVEGPAAAHDPVAGAAPGRRRHEHAGTVGEQTAVLRVDHLDRPVGRRAVPLDPAYGGDLARRDAVVRRRLPPAYGGELGLRRRGRGRGRGGRRRRRRGGARGRGRGRTGGRVPDAHPVTRVPTPSRSTLRRGSSIHPA